MQTAGFNNVIITIFWIIVSLYIFKIVARILFPIVIKKVVQKATQNMQSQFNNQQNNSAKAEEIIKNKNPKPNKDIGEYIDYEEIN